MKNLLGYLLILLLLWSPISLFADEQKSAINKRGEIWNLQDADILSVINAVSQETGKNFVVDPRVQGKISLVSSKPIQSQDLYDVFLSILELLGYSAIPNGKVITIVPNTESTEMATHVATNQSPGQGEEIVVRIIPLEHVSASQLLPSLRPLLPQWSNISAYAPGNLLIVAGRASNLARIMDIIHRVDQASNDIEIVPLKQASAVQIASVLNNLQTASRTSGETPTVFITPDERTNSILLSGTRSARTNMHAVISQLETSSTRGIQDNTQVVYLRYLQAITLAPTLSKIANNLLDKNDSSSKPTAGSPKLNTDIQTSIQAEPGTNALIITASPPLMHALTAIIKKLDVRPAQVLVEGIIVEINQDDLRNLGIQWGSVSPQGTVTTTTNPNPTSFPPLGAGVVGIIPNQQIQAILNVLENKNSVNILSTPTLVVLDNHDAVLRVGQDIPEQSGSYATTGSTSTVTPFNTINRKQVTLTFKVTPQINLGTAVRLKLDLTNDSLQNPENITLNPIINTSQISNSVIINSGDILVLGGLIRNNVISNTNKVPILSDIPIVGELFQSKSRKLEKKNLMVFIKPVILHDGEDAACATSTKYENARDAQIHWPVELSDGEQKRQNVLPLWKNNLDLPKPFKN